MKTIWIVYPYGGIVGERFLEARYVRFGRRFTQNGYRVVFWTSNFSHGSKRKRSRSWKDIAVSDEFTIRIVPAFAYKRNISIRRVLSEIKFSHSLSKGFKAYDKPDLFLVSSTGFLTAFYPVWPYVRDNPTPIIYDIMDVHPFSRYMERHHKTLLPFAKALVKSIERRERPFLDHVDAICGLGKNQIEIAKRRVARSGVPSCLVYNGISVDEFRERMELPCKVRLPEKREGEIWCVYAGSLGPSYDISTLLECAQMLHGEGEEIRFIIAGAGPQSELVERASDENPSVLFLGSVNSEWLPAIYKLCDIGLCTYASYSTVDMPDKFYDYTAAGLAIVSSLGGEVKDYVDAVGVQYESENSRSLHDSILEAIERLEWRKSASYDLAKSFDLDLQMEPLIEMIDTMLE